MYSHKNNCPDFLDREDLQTEEFWNSWIAESFYVLQGLSLLHMIMKARDSLLISCYGRVDYGLKCVFGCWENSFLLIQIYPLFSPHPNLPLFFIIDGKFARIWVNISVDIKLTRDHYCAWIRNLVETEFYVIFRLAFSSSS